MTVKEWKINYKKLLEETLKTASKDSKSDREKLRKKLDPIEGVEKLPLQAEKFSIFLKKLSSISPKAHESFLKGFAEHFPYELYLTLFKRIRQIADKHPDHALVGCTLAGSPVRLGKVPGEKDPGKRKATAPFKDIDVLSVLDLPEKESAWVGILASSADMMGLKNKFKILESLGLELPYVSRYGVRQREGLSKIDIERQERKNYIQRLFEEGHISEKAKNTFMMMHEMNEEMENVFKLAFDAQFTFSKEHNPKDAVTFLEKLFEKDGIPMLLLGPGFDYKRMSFGDISLLEQARDRALKKYLKEHLNKVNEPMTSLDIAEDFLRTIGFRNPYLEKEERSMRGRITDLTLKQELVDYYTKISGMEDKEREEFFDSFGEGFAEYEEARYEELKSKKPAFSKQDKEELKIIKDEEDKQLEKRAGIRLDRKFMFDVFSSTRHSPLLRKYAKHLEENILPEIAGKRDGKWFLSRKKTAPERKKKRRIR